MSGNLGFLVGISHAKGQEAVDSHAKALADMRAELTKKLNDAAYQAAFKEAAAEVHAEIVHEIESEAKGRLVKRRLSDPKNVEGRNEAYAEKAASAVNRISSGRISMSRISIDRVKGNRPLK